MNERFKFGLEGEKKGKEFLIKNGFDVVYPLPFDALAMKDGKIYGVEMKARNGKAYFNKSLLKGYQQKIYSELDLPIDLPIIVTLYNNDKVVMKMFDELQSFNRSMFSGNSKQAVILDYVRIVFIGRTAVNGKTSISEIVRFTECPRDEVKNAIDLLIVKGFVEQIDSRFYKWKGKE